MTRRLIREWRGQEMTALPARDIPGLAGGCERREGVALPRPVSPEMLRGPWTLDIGLLGRGDDQRRGGVLHVEPGHFFGGDSIFAYDGCWTLCGATMTAELEVHRHRGAPRTPTLFGTDEEHYRLECIGRLVWRDLIEGKVRRPGFPDARFAMGRLPFKPR